MTGRRRSYFLESHWLSSLDTVLVQESFLELILIIYEASNFLATFYFTKKCSLCINVYHGTI